MFTAVQPTATRSPSHLLGFAPSPRAHRRRRLQLQDGLAGAVAVAFLKRRHARVCQRAVGDIRIDVASSSDLRGAADVAVRSLRWTKGWLDAADFGEQDYALLAGREVMAYQSLYLADNGFPSTLLVAKREETKETSWFDIAASGSSSKVVGCVGCEVKCFNRFNNQEVPITQYDGGPQTVLRPVMADLAVSSECRGQGLGRRLVERLEEVVQEWGYDEVVLLVEATNFQAASVYDKLGYRLSALRSSEMTFYLDKSQGGRSVKERGTVALLLRKSLKGFPQGTLENLNWWSLCLAALAALAVAETAEGQALLKEMGIVLNLN